MHAVSSHARTRIKPGPHPSPKHSQHRRPLAACRPQPRRGRRVRKRVLVLTRLEPNHALPERGRGNEALHGAPGLQRPDATAPAIVRSCSASIPTTLGAGLFGTAVVRVPHAAQRVDGQLLGRVTQARECCPHGRWTGRLRSSTPARPPYVAQPPCLRRPLPSRPPCGTGAQGPSRPPGWRSWGGRPRRRTAQAARTGACACGPPQRLPATWGLGCCCCLGPRCCTELRCLEASSAHEARKPRPRCRGWWGGCVGGEGEEGQGG